MPLSNEQRGNLLLLAHDVHHNRPWDELALGYLRYEALRKLNCHEVEDLHKRNMYGDNFDDMVDELVLRGAGK